MLSLLKENKSFGKLIVALFISEIGSLFGAKFVIVLCGLIICSAGIISMFSIAYFSKKAVVNEQLSNNIPQAIGTEPK
jgi:hypothetical protein